MVTVFHFAFELVDNFVYVQSFLIENFYCMTLAYVLFTVFVRFVYMVRKDLVDKKNLVDQCSNLCFADLYWLVGDFDYSVFNLLNIVVDF